MTHHRRDETSGGPAAAAEEDEDATTQIPAGLAKSLIADEASTTQIPRHLVATLMAKQGLVAQPAPPAVSGVVPPPPRPGRRERPAPAPIAPLPPALDGLADSLMDMTRDAPPPGSGTYTVDGEALPFEDPGVGAETGHSVEIQLDEAGNELPSEGGIRREFAKSLLDALGLSLDED
jgi:hypothetical protein